MFLYLLLFTIGLLLLLKGGDLFVESSMAISLYLKIPRIVVGGTIVSLATTTPELFVSTTASYMGDSGIAVGNALGSAIANIGLIVGISAILAPIAIDVKDFRRRSIWMLISAFLVFFFSWDLIVSRSSGIILFALGVSYLVLNTLRAFIERNKNETDNSVPGPGSSAKNAVLQFILGGILVIVGSKLLVNSGIKIAEILQVPSLIIGLTAIAVGTSLPELVTAITSARKKVADLSIGNIVGANILNLAFITGASAMIRPLNIDLFTRYYAFSWLFIMCFGMTFILWKKGKMGKNAGIFLLFLYIIYNAGLIFYA